MSSDYIAYCVPACVPKEYALNIFEKETNPFKRDHKFDMIYNRKRKDSIYIILEDIIERPEYISLKELMSRYKSYTEILSYVIIGEL